MGFLTWADKVGIIPKKIRINQWQDDDANETKTAVNDNDTRIGVLEPKVTSLETGQTGGLISFTTKAILDAHTDAGNNDSYKVTNDSTSSNNGYYHWSGSAYVKDASLANGEVAEGDPDAVEGGKIFDNNKIQSLFDINRGSVTIENNVITLGVGNHFFIDKTNTTVSTNVAIEEVHTLGHNESLVFEKNTTSFVKKSNSSVSMVDDIHLLNYDSTAGLGGGLWYKLILSNETANIKNNALYSICRASVIISGANVTVGSQFIYTTFRDGTVKTLNHSETLYAMPSGGRLVHNFTTNTLEIRTSSQLEYDDAVVLVYDGSEGFNSGLWYAKKVLNEKIDLNTTNISYFGFKISSITYRASILSISGNVITIGSGNYFFLNGTWDGGQSPKMSANVGTNLTFTLDDTNGRYIVFEKANDTFGYILQKKFDDLDLSKHCIIGYYDFEFGGLLQYRIFENANSFNNVENFRIKSGLEVVAHQGVTVNEIAPKNSLDSFKMASRCGFKFVETDLQKTSDGEYVVIHDPSLNSKYYNYPAYTPIAGMVNTIDNTLATLKADYVQISNTVRFRQPIPSLLEFLKVCRRYKIYPIIEMKGLILSDVPLVISQCNEILGASNYGLTSFDNNMLDEVRTITNDVKLYYISENDPVVLKAKINAVGYLDYTTLNETLVKSFKNEGVGIGAYTTQIEQFNNMQNLGVEFVATDTMANDIEGFPILSDFSDGTFEKYTHNGTLTDGVLTLTTGQVVSLTNPSITLYLAAFFLDIESKGDITVNVSTSVFTDTIINTENKSDIYQGLIHDKQFTLTITANATSEIKEIKFNLVRY